MTPGKPVRDRPRTQEERKAESEKRIIKAAIQLFADQGYLRTTLIDIGKAADCTGGLVSHRFGSKEGLLQAVVDHITGRFLKDQIEPAIGKPGLSAEQALREYLAIYLGEVFLREGRMRTLYVIMGEALGAVPEIRPAMASLNKGIRHYLRQIIERGIESGEFNKSVDAEAAAVLIFGMLRGVILQYLTDPGVFKEEDMLPVLQEAAVAGLK